MSDYKKMYFSLFNAVTDVIYDLQKAQQDNENWYIENGDETVTILKHLTDNDKNGLQIIGGRLLFVAIVCKRLTFNPT